MTKEEKIAEEIKMYSQMAAKDKGIDVTALALNALGNKSATNNVVSDRQRRMAYVISLGLPPLGLLFAAKLYFSGKDDGKSTALICLILTAASIILSVVIFNMLLSGSGVDSQQIQSIKPEDIRSLVE
jgi:hypothetical protein